MTAVTLLPVPRGTCTVVAYPGWEVFWLQLLYDVVFFGDTGEWCSPVCAACSPGPPVVAGGVVGWEPHSGRVAIISVFVCQVIGVLVPVSFTSR